MKNLYDFEVRVAKPEDAPYISDITKTAFKEYCVSAKLKTIAALSETVKDIIRDIETKTVYVAVINDIIVGCVRIEILGDGTAYLSRFAVKQDNQNTGIGKILMNVVDKNMRRKGVKSIKLHTASTVAGLIRFYYGRGFYISEVENSRGYPRATLVKEYI